MIAPSQTLTALPVLAGKKLIVFDGTCVLCSGFFRFVLKRDPARKFHFATAQSALGEALYAHYGLKSGDYDTNLVILNGRLHREIDALAAVLREIGGAWRMGAIVAWLPAPAKTFIYNRIARNRYALFGRREVCYLPTPDLQARFLG
jgi:predicted DCC family thiol-disulfide oxidoreductase YuxK